MSSEKPTPIQFGTQLATHDSGILSSELAENIYLEPAPKGGKFKYTLRSTPGLSFFVQPQANGPVRGMIDFNGLLFAVIGNSLYKITSGGSTTLIGSVTGSGPVSMAHNGSYIWIAVPGSKLYAADGSSILDLSGSLYNVNSVAAQDGYIMASEANTKTWYLSGLDTLANTVSGLFSDADANPGNTVAIISDHREVLVFKTDSVEAYYNSGNPAFPFERTQVVERGCGASESVAKYRNSVYWLGDDLQVYAMSGYQPKPISTPVVTRLIEARSGPQSAVGFTYQQGGHAFYVLSFGDYTLVYDIDTGLWHRRKSHLIDRWRVNTYTYMASWRKHIVGDYDTGDLYELNLDTYTENGKTVVRAAQSSPIWNSGLGFIVDEFFLDIEAGTALQRSRETAWAVNTAYTVGDLVSNNSCVYECVTAGTSYTAGDGPLGNGSDISESPLGEIMVLLNEIRTDFTTHKESTGFHTISDTTAILSAATDLPTALALGNNIRTVYEAHRASAAYHASADTTNTITAAVAISVDTLLTLVNDLRTKYEAHRADAVVHATGDGTNTISTAAVSTNAVRWDYQYVEDWGEDPMAILDYSNDGGKTWSTQLQRSLGQIGEYTKQPRWYRLGRHRNLLFRIRISDPIAVRINGAYVRMDALGV